MTSPNPYEALLGKDWECLPEGIRLSHQVPLRSFGNLKVVRAWKGLAGLMARVLILPPNGDSVPVTLDLAQTQQGIYWVRTFGDHPINTLHTFHGTWFSEHMGSFALCFELKALPDRLCINQIGLRAFGIPLPRWFGPRVTGTVTQGPDGNSWHIDVLIRHAWLGDICHYHGIMREE